MVRRRARQVWGWAGAFTPIVDFAAQKEALTMPLCDAMPVVPMRAQVSA